MTARKEHEVAPSAGSLTVDQSLEVKLHWPTPREGWVERGRLLDALDRASRRRVTLVAAPAGYGKTTVAAQWLATRRGERAAAWVSLDAGDNDPARLWTHVATALQRAGCPVAADLAAFLTTSTANVRGRLLPALVDALAAMPDGVTLVLDDFHLVRSLDCQEQVRVLIENLPPSANLLITSRSDPALRLGRLRASGDLAELRAHDLSFTVDDATALVALEHVELRGTDVAQLVSDTEGWPAGLYLTVLALSRADRARGAVPAFDRSHRFVGDYIAEEVLSQHAPPVRDLILASSILDRFCAPLCDVVAGTSDAATILQELARENLFLVPLDHDGVWYRFHHLFAAVARAELETRQGDGLSTLHRRAADWLLANGHVDDAVAHLLAAADHPAAARVIQAHWFQYYDAGRSHTVRTWLRSLDPVTLATDPAAVVTAAWMAAAQGDRPALETHVAALGPLMEVGPLPDGTQSIESAVALIRGFYGYGGPLDMACAARRAVELETDVRTRNYAMATYTLGHCAYVFGDLDEATTLLTKVRHAEAAPALILVTCYAVQAVIEDERGRYDESRSLVDQALAIVDAREMHDMPQVSGAYTALAQAQASAGRLTEATATCRHVLAMRRDYPTLSPWPMIHHLAVMSRVAVRTGDLTLAAELLAEVDVLMDGFEQMDAMQARLEFARDAVRAASTRTAMALSPREVDVVRLLQTSLSLREIGEQLLLSPNTVKSHTRMVFRKLGAHSREAAVAAAREQGLI